MGCALSNSLATPTKSAYGFVADDPALSVADIDLIWALVTDTATKSYGELVMLRFAARQLRFRILTTSGDTRIAGDTIFVKRAPCIAESELIAVFVALSSDILKRNVAPVIDVVVEQLLPFCVDRAETPNRPLPQASDDREEFPDSSIEGANEEPTL